MTKDSNDVDKPCKKRKPKGSDSADKVLNHAHRGLQLFAEYQPRASGRIQAFTREVMKAGKISKKNKELIALGMALTQTCHYCIAMHIRSCYAAKVSVDEIMEVCGLAIMMGGGPAMAHVAEVERCLNKFYLDEEGDLIN